MTFEKVCQSFGEGFIIGLALVVFFVLVFAFCRFAAWVVRPRHRADRCECDNSVHGGRPCTQAPGVARDCLWCGSALCRVCYDFHACETEQRHRLHETVAAR